MKYFKLTLFKKIFFIIFCGFLCVLALNSYEDYVTEIRNESYYYRIDINLGPLGQRFDSFQENLTNEFIEFYDKFYQGTLGYHYIMNKNNDILHKIEYSDERYKKKIMCINDLEYASSIEVSLKNLDQKTLNQLEDYIYESFYDKPKEGIYIDIALETKPIKGKQCYDISYLKFKDIEYNPSKRTQAKKSLIEIYYSKNYSYYCYGDDGYPHMHDLKKEREICQEVALDTAEFLTANGTTPFYQERDTLLYYTHLYGNSESEWKLIDVIPGRTVQDIKDTVFYNKEDVYMCALIITFMMSLLISYMLTRRIKKIEKTTKLIANNEFDLKLKEKPRDELGDLSHSINIMSEKLKNTVDQLNQEIKHVKELESLRKDFINQFTHEMKTPLGIINGYSELLDEVQNEEEREKYIKIINRETETINQLILSMLNLSRLEAKKVELKIENIDLEDLITEVIDEYEVLLMKKNVKVQIDVVDGYLKADYGLMKTVIQNFMSNAIKHVTVNGHIEVVINRGCYIYNDGKFIPEENLTKIWHTFVTDEQKGSGLGLAICASILELHGFEYGTRNKKYGVEFYFRDK